METGLLTNKQRQQLAAAISSRDMEVVAQGYLDIDSAVIERVRDEHFNGKADEVQAEACNTALLQRWANRPENSGPHRLWAERTWRRTVHGTGGSRISQTGVAPTYYSAKFRRKLHEMKKIGPRKGGEGWGENLLRLAPAHLRNPGSTSATCLLLDVNLKEKKCFTKISRETFKNQSKHTQIANGNQMTPCSGESKDGTRDLPHSIFWQKN